MEKIAIIYLDAPGMEEQLMALRVPEGMEIQLLSVPASETNLAEAFQQAMEQSDARYKVYISANIEILENDILPRMIEAFQQHPNIGLLGLSGTKRVLTSGITYTSPQRIGIALDEASRPLVGRTAKRSCEDVQVLDGYLLATQQDVAWRKDIVHGSLFLGAAASVEHRRAGYDVAVLAEAAPACRLPDELTADDGEQDAFLDEYSADLYPLVSVVIPTYQRPDYFRQSLGSAQRQTYRHLDIFVTDNSHNEETKAVYEESFADDPRIHYEFHPDFDAAGNWGRAGEYDNPRAEYVNWLMDDDLFAPQKIATMMDCYFQYPDVTLVTSYRSMIDGEGNALPDAPWTQPLCETTSRLSGNDVGGLVLRKMVNYIGEPTTVLIRKKYMNNNQLGWTGKEGKYRISDFPTWLCLLSQGDMIYIREPLSTFRLHGNQQQYSVETNFSGMICWSMMMREAIGRNLFLQTDEDKQEAIIHWMDVATGNLQILQNYPKDIWNTSYVQDLLKVYAGMAAALSNGYQIEYAIDTTPEK